MLEGEVLAAAEAILALAYMGEERPSDPEGEARWLTELAMLRAPSPLPPSLLAESELLATLTLDRYGAASRVECLKLLSLLGGVEPIRHLLGSGERR